MIRAGKLDRIVTLERKVETVAASGAVSEAWAPIATIRAELVQRSAEEFLASDIERETVAVIFRIRWRADISTADRLTYLGRAYDLEEIAELGRRQGLELRAVAA
ncbi:phage head closure protein [Roseivivax sp. THAF197b]|uniref:phage head closure protein n=1 Tax=Roseivivax sp. THAF197b TaxID=2588299 RepID=UPI001267FA6B|nr:phage head closure protein [Roseivivax sp. THAF197b]QFS82345.1 Phage head-tail joining protein [Roseivivax sp. THAF197b]